MSEPAVIGGASGHPKVGDRVRCTLGESVLVGEVLESYISSLAVRADGDDDECDTRVYLERWTVEVLPPPIPDTIGTIVADRNGMAWERYERGWNSTCGSRMISVGVASCLRPAHGAARRTAGA